MEDKAPAKERKRAVTVQCSIWQDVCVCLSAYVSVYVCELITRAAMSVRRPSSCPSLLPPFPPFLLLFHLASLSLALL